MLQLDYQDFITYEEKAIMLVPEKHMELIEKPRYQPLFVALRKGPMTVKDLLKEYNQVVANEVEKMDLETKEKAKLKEKMKRKSKSIYKYLDFFEKKKLIIQVGKRIKMGQTATETLFGRAAKIFLVEGYTTSLIKGESVKNLNILSDILCLELKEKDISIQCLAKALKKIFTTIQSENNRIFRTYSEEITKNATNASYEELKKLVNEMEILSAIIHARDFEKELNECFEK